MEPLNLAVDPRGPFGINRSMFGNPAYGDLRYDPTRFRPALTPVNTAAPAGEWTAKPLPPSNPSGFTPIPASPNPTPASPTLSPRPLSGPVAAPPTAKVPISPGGLGPAANALSVLPLLASSIATAAGDSRKLAEAAYEAGQNPGRGNLAVALTLFPLAPFALAGVASNNPRPASVPDWLWPFPDPPSPNELDPAALDAGPTITPGTPPPFTGGQGYGISYSLTFTAGDTTGTRQSTEQTISGKILGTDVRPNPAQGTQTAGILRQLTPGGTVDFIPLISSFASQDSSPVISNVRRADGQPDTSGNPSGGTDPVRAPNPARQTSTPTTPRNLPSPTPPPASSDLPWPETAAQETPDTRLLSPPAPAPNFSPTPDPVPPTAPGTTPQPTDLDAPRETPPNLEDDPLTPPAKDPLTPLDKATPTAAPKSPLSALNNPLAPLVVAIPVVLIDGLRQKVNTPSGNLIDRTQPNPNIQVVKPPPPPTVTTPNPPTCIYERERVRDIQNKATDVQEKASNPVSGFPGLYGIGIESRLKLGQTFDLLGGVNQFMRQAWQSTRLQKVLDVLTFVGVMHNASMLSRNLGQTFLEVIGQGIQAVGIRDEENKVIDVNEVVSENVEGLLKNVLGVETYNGINEAWNKASRIISTASAVIMTVRSIADSTSELLEWTAENTGRLGNALKRWRVVGENAYPDMSESAQAHYKGRGRFDKLTGTLTNAEDRLSTYEQATSTVIELEEATSELIQNYGEFRKSVIEGVPDPWADNLPIKEANDADKAASTAPNIEVSDSQKG